MRPDQLQDTDEAIYVDAPVFRLDPYTGVVTEHGSRGWDAIAGESATGSSTKAIEADEMAAYTTEATQGPCRTRHLRCASEPLCLSWSTSHGSCRRAAGG